MRPVIVLAIIIFVILALPFLLWQIQPNQPLEVAVLSSSTEEYNGVNFLLDQLKYTNNKDNNHDVLYLGHRDSGLSEDEWTDIVNWINRKDSSLLVAEHNIFSPPTSSSVRESLTSYLGVDWSGWTGKYFHHLDASNEEIPLAILESYGDSWDYSGGGFILVNDFDYEILVLQMDKHISKAGIDLSYTHKGKEIFGLDNSPDYSDWFQIITPLVKGSELATFSWDLTREGEDLLIEHNIPTEFPAIVEANHGLSSSYYFAGNFSRLDKLPSMYKVKGLQKIYSIGERFSDSSFYWSTYFPIMETILNNYDRSFNEIDFLDRGELKYNARLRDDSFQLLVDDSWTDLLIKGVNIGMAKPGTFPGEAGISEQEYYRWFEQIGQMNANTIRIYTLHPPGFYNALLRYNENHENKIYVMHGVWINEEELVGSQDAFEENNLADFQDEMRRIVDVIHGNKIVEAKPGHASGVYNSDISQYVIAWVLGVEWDPFVVENTNLIHKSMEDYKGKYFETQDAQPFEIWLAQQMDIITEYEVDNYRYIRPMSFTNWVTTDILDHPADLSGKEDIVSVDPNVIYIKGEMELTGQFASYHIYPYYPDFLNYEERYRTYIDHRGDFNNYAAYLKELNDVHRLPILVAEFGVPASRGITHTNPFGWNQGFLSEKEQGDIVTRLFEDILEEGMLGGLVFTWQDEWFKRTWNTMDYDNPDRRPFWSNAQTNEQQFGILSFDRHKIQVDGHMDEWEADPLYSKDAGNIKGLYADYDERYLYLRLDYGHLDEAYPLILLDVLPDQGNDFMTYKGIDFLIDLNKDESRILIDEYYDFFTYMYAYDLEMIEKPSPNPYKNSGKFIEIHYVLSRDYPSENKDIAIEFTTHETGKLKLGNGNPYSDDYDSLADYYINESGGLELRIPWLLIQARDPSNREFIGDLYKDGLEASQSIDEIFIAALYMDGQGNMLDSTPMQAYSWETWHMPQYEERLKQSYYIIQKLFK